MTSLRGQRRIRSAVVLRPASSLSKKAWSTGCCERYGTALERLKTEFSTTVSLTGCMLFASDRYERKSMNPSKTMTLAWDAGMALSDSQAIGSLPAWNDAVAPIAGQSMIAVIAVIALIALTSLVALTALLSVQSLTALVALHPLSVVMYLGEEPPLNRSERSVGENPERGDGGRTQDRQGISGSWTLANTR
jgi:hypothetical protein